MVRIGPVVRVGPVVLIGSAGLRWDDVTPEGTPHLWRLLQEGAVADLVTG